MRIWISPCLAAAAGKAIFCEKPLDLDLARARECRPAIIPRKNAGGIQPAL